jgi:hypothetical protein
MSAKKSVFVSEFFRTGVVAQLVPPLLYWLIRYLQMSMGHFLCAGVIATVQLRTSKAAHFVVQSRSIFV